MEAADSILDVIHEEVSVEDGEDVDMMDVEEGEVVEGQMSGEISVLKDEVEAKSCKENPQHTNNMNKNKKRKKKKKNKKKKVEPGSNFVDVDRFVLDICKRLKEVKTYLVYTAVGVLGVSALSDLVKEVDAVQACGGQMTADGYRFRKGGGILWKILKARDPNAFKEIMKKGKEFEKQFKRPNIVQAPKKIDNTTQKNENAMSSKTSASISENGFEIEKQEEEEEEEEDRPSIEVKRRPVHDRIRVPVSYEDVVGDELPKDEPPN